MTAGSTASAPTTPTAVGARRLRIRVPTARPPSETGAPAFVLDRPIAGLKVGLRHEGSWRSWILIVDEWSKFLRRDGATPVVVKTGERTSAEGERTRALVADWAASVDCGVSGLGTCGSCTSWSVHDAVSLEKQKRPAIVAVTEEFAQHAHNMANHLGHKNLKVLVLPYPLEARPEDELKKIAFEYYPKFLEMLGATAAAGAKR
ncbi:MAG: hypothetical protein IPK00_11300 [Deltaproteobacteria bacterium]|nr:hypothetical protein [Deltaproteobacteria bacterium]